MASVSPRDEGQAEADAGGVVGVAEALEGQEDRVRGRSGGCPGRGRRPGSPPGRRAGCWSGAVARRRVSSAARWRRGWPGPVRAVRVGVDAAARSSGGVDDDAPAVVGPRSSRARATTSSTAVGWTSIDMAPACRRLMSSRLSTSAASRSRDVVRGLRAARGGRRRRRSTSRLSRLETAALAAASGVRRSWPTAASSAVRTLLASASGAASAAARLSRMRSSTTAAWAANAPTRRWSSACSSRPRRASTSGLAGGHLGVGVAGPRAPLARRWPRTAQPSSVRSSSVTEVEAEGLPHPLAASRRAPSSPPSTLPARLARVRDSAAARAACRVRRAARSTAELTSAATSDEDEQRERVVGLADGQRVQRRREVVVEQQRAERRRRSAPAPGRRRGRRRPSAAGTAACR